MYNATLDHLPASAQGYEGANQPECCEFGGGIV